MTADPHAQASRTFADCLNLLFEASAKEDPTKPGTFVEYTNAEIADAINKKFGAGTITGEYIRRLRKGDIKSPSVQYASVLADVFQVPLDTFNAVSETAEKVMTEAQRFVDSRRQMFSSEPEPTVAVLARTARRLSPDGQARAARFVQQLQQIEELENQTRARVAHD
ncbi:hypothetical protein ABZ023_17930 [Streptomyces sp. NPDC006367]|uniref:hypothetical protein n=1 Tax=unclassified Streptomyces TaxID=2593676 RepID=UPI0033AB4DF1